MVSTNSSSGPLDGLRVVDVTRVLAGPYSTMMLADMGADVIKVEHPLAGDETRSWGPPFTGEFSAYFLAVNRNKRSIGIDLSKPAGREALLSLLNWADVLIENFRPSSLAHLRLERSRLKERFPKLVHCHLYAYQPEGPAAELPGYDILIQAESGLMSLTGDPAGPPMKVGVAVVDVCAGAHAAVAILAALLRRERSGRGEYVQIGLMDVALASLVNVAQGYLVSAQRPARYGNAHPSIVPYRDFRTADGAIIVAVGNDRQWSQLCAALGLEKWGKSPSVATNEARVRDRQMVETTLQQHFEKRPSSEWIDLLRGAGVPAGPINTVDDALASYSQLLIDLELGPASQTAAIRSPMRFEQGPVSYRRRPPKLGEQTEEILRSALGYTDDQIASLRREGAIK